LHGERDSHSSDAPYRSDGVVRQLDRGGHELEAFIGE